MPSTSIRWPLTKHLAALFADHPNAGALAVLAFPPGEMEVSDEMLVATKISSTSGVPTSRAGRLDRDEFVSIEWTLMVNGTTSPDDLMTRFDEIAAVVEDVFADDASFGDFDGVIDGTVTDTEASPTRANDGFYIVGKVTVQIHTRLN